MFFQNDVEEPVLNTQENKGSVPDSKAPDVVIPKEPVKERDASELIESTPSQVKIDNVWVPSTSDNMGKNSDYTFKNSNLSEGNLEKLGENKIVEELKKSSTNETMASLDQTSSEFEISQTQQQVLESSSDQQKISSVEAQSPEFSNVISDKDSLSQSNIKETETEKEQNDSKIESADQSDQRTVLQKGKFLEDSYFKDYKHVLFTAVEDVMKKNSLPLKENDISSYLEFREKNNSDESVASTLEESNCELKVI